MRRINIIGLIILIIAALLALYSFIKFKSTSDNEAPVITGADEQLEVSVEDDESIFLEGVSATDDKDGDVTDTMVVEKLSDFNEDYERIVTLAAFDSSGGVSTAKRKIKYTDYRQPHFSIKEPLIFTASTTDFLENIEADDCLDGDITSNISFSSKYEVTTDVAGDYDMELQVVNSAGDVAYLPVTITISNDDVVPLIYLEDYVVYVSKNGEIDYEDLITSVSYSGMDYDVSESGVGDYNIGYSEFTIDDSEVNLSKVGNYVAIYKLSIDNSKKGIARLNVVVED